MDEDGNAVWFAEGEGVSDDDHMYVIEEGTIEIWRDGAKLNTVGRFIYLKFPQVLAQQQKHNYQTLRQSPLTVIRMLWPVAFSCDPVTLAVVVNLDECGVDVKLLFSRFFLPGPSKSCNTSPPLQNL